LFASLGDASSVGWVNLGYLFLVSGVRAHQWLGAQGENNLLLPWPAQPHKDVLLGDIGNALLVVVLRVVTEDDAFHFVRGPTKPPLVEVVQDRLELRLRAGDVGHIADRYAQGAPENAAQVRRRVRQLVCFVVAPLYRDEDAQIVLSRHDFDGSARKLGRDLIEALGVDALLGAADIECADGRVV
jgi:hypothetical protein